MSNNLTLSDAINEALDTGKEATFLYNGTLYTFSPAGLIAFITAEGNFAAPNPDPSFTTVTTGDLTATGTSLIILPTTDPEIVGVLWNNAGTITVSAGA
jgi:hypothetical protein